MWFSRPVSYAQKPEISQNSHYGSESNFNERVGKASEQFKPIQFIVSVINIMRKCEELNKLRFFLGFYFVILGLECMS